jgi:prepilin-type N-terminal cleavage/methylation domain-containing protein
MIGGLSMFGKGREGMRGFTLLELIVVIAVIGILATIAIPQFVEYRLRSLNEVARADLRNAAIAQEAYYLDMNTYTARISDLTSRGYTPKDGVTTTIIVHNNSGYTMTTVHTSGTKTWTLTGPGGNIQ